MVKITLFASFVLGAVVMLSGVAPIDAKKDSSAADKKTCYCVDNIYSSSSCCSKYHSGGKLNKAGSRCILKNSEQKDIYTSCCQNLANVHSRPTGFFNFGGFDNDQDELMASTKKAYKCY